MNRSLVVLLALVAGLVPVLFLDKPASGAGQLPSGFVQDQVTNGVFRPTTMEFAPDGRLFVLEQDGAVRIIKDGKLLPEPFLKFRASKIDSEKERGLLGIAFDPDFTRGRPYVYLHYTQQGTSTSPARNRVVRFTANGDKAVTGSMRPIFELEALRARNHNGGAIHFGKDKRLYVAVGDNGVMENAQKLTTTKGKILRINADGSIPSDNPFRDRTSGRNEAIWALGFRNPFSFAVQPGTGRIFVNDVGARVWEEVDDLRRAGNYGWPICEGKDCAGRPPGNYKPPIFAYKHGAGESQGCSITGGAFYNPPRRSFPESYTSDYFFADFCAGWIKMRSPGGAVAPFKGMSDEFPVDLKVAPDGSLYVLTRAAGTVERISYNP